MKKLLLSLVVSLCASDVFAGPVIDRIRERRDARHQATCTTTPVTVVQPTPTVVTITQQPAVTVQSTFGFTTGGCTNGQCAPVTSGRGFLRR